MKRLRHLFTKKKKIAEINDKLFYATLSGDADSVRELLAKGANTNSKNEQGWTPLMVAASEGDRRLVDALLSRGAHIDAKSKNRETSLMLASRSGHLGVVRMLLVDAEANPDLKNKAGKTALNIAKENGQIKIAEFIESYIAESKKQNEAVNWKKIKKANYLNYARKLESNKNYTQAEKGYKSAIKNNPKSIQAHNSLAQLLFRQERYDEVIDVYEEAIQNNPNNAIAFHSLAGMYINRDRFEDAKRIYDKAIRMAPQHQITKSIKIQMDNAKKALARIEAGNDNCIECGAKFSASFLKAMPDITHCGSCKKRMEEGKKDK